MISSLVRFGSGGSTTTSQCSKSHPSNKIVSFGGLLLQFGEGSLRDDVVRLVEKHLTAPFFLIDAVDRPDGERSFSDRTWRERTCNRGKDLTVLEKTSDRDVAVKSVRSAITAATEYVIVVGEIEK